MVDEPISKVKRNDSKNSKKSKLKGDKIKFSEEQLSILKNFYSKNQYPNLKQRKGLSSDINCLEKQVNCWFQNTRRPMPKSDSLVNSKCSTVVSISSTVENSTFPSIFNGGTPNKQAPGTIPDKSTKMDSSKLSADKSDIYQYTHFVIELKDGSAKCTQCDKNFASSISARAHARLKHFQQKKYKCSKCDYIGNEMYLRTHLNSKHNLKGKNLITTYCSKIDESPKKSSEDIMEDHDKIAVELASPKRARFTEEQLSILKNFYNQNPYPNLTERESLSNQIGSKEKTVKYWFEKTSKASCKSDSLVTSVTSKILDLDAPQTSVNMEKFELDPKMEFNVVDTASEITSTPDDSMMSDFDTPKQKPMPKRYVPQDTKNCDKCKNEVKYSTDHYDGRFCLDCINACLNDVYEVTEENGELFQCEFCGFRNILPDIYIHIDKKHYDNILTKIPARENESRKRNHEDETDQKKLPDSKHCKIIKDEFETKSGIVMNRFNRIQVFFWFWDIE